MFQVRIHGRGGQGIVTAAEMLSLAAFDEGRHAQAFPSFGSERNGAPVVSFCRIDDRPIRLREPVVEPDALLIQDPTLLHQVDVFAGLKADGYVLINTAHSFDELGLGELRRRPARRARCSRCPRATSRASTRAGPSPNAALLAGLRGAQRADLAGLRRPGDPREASGEGRRGQRRRPPSRPTPGSRTRCGRSHAEADGGLARRRGDRRALPAGGDLRLPDLAADAHRREPLASS